MYSSLLSDFSHSSLSWGGEGKGKGKERGGEEREGGGGTVQYSTTYVGKAKWVRYLNSPMSSACSERPPGNFHLANCRYM